MPHMDPRLCDEVIAMDFISVPATIAVEDCIDGDGTKCWDTGEMAIAQLMKALSKTSVSA